MADCAGFDDEALRLFGTGASAPTASLPKASAALIDPSNVAETMVAGGSALTAIVRVSAPALLPAGVDAIALRKESPLHKEQDKAKRAAHENMKGGCKRRYVGEWAKIV